MGLFSLKIVWINAIWLIRGFSGPRYTWTNKKDINNLILERIDRFFINPGWCMLYPDARVTHLPKCHSDHCPILIEVLPIREIRLLDSRNVGYWIYPSRMLSQKLGVEQEV